ncbi:MAG: hypothetical protein H6999_07115 [Hahellaceae bacterium]|nr:hypothetical protein [Hahellaceae bacterium]
MSVNPKLHHFDTYKDDIRSRLVSEVIALQAKVYQLRSSSSLNRDIMISTYEKMISRKEHFLSQHELNGQMRRARV